VNRLTAWNTTCIILLICVAAPIFSSAQTFTNLVTFDITNGAYPYGTLVQGLDGTFYGITSEGGRQRCSGGCGTVFKVTPDGVLTIVHSFVGTDGGYPVTGLVMAASGNFYGSTFGRSQASGTEPSYFFEITPAGTLTNLQAGGSTEPLVQDTIDGNFYGTSLLNGLAPGTGMIFRMTATGTLTTLHDFCQLKNCPDGSDPMAPLFQGNDAFLYGTTETGGDDGVLCDNSTGCGTVFKIGLGGSLDRLHAFDGTDGSNPAAGLVQGSDGNFYGTTAFGGEPAGFGTVFKITSGGTFTNLYKFCTLGVPCSDGSNPSAALVQATDGNFYGTTAYGGTSLGCHNGCGTIFQITPAGALTTLHIFDKTDGVYPSSGLMQGTDGNLYGTTTGNIGLHLYGTVFKLSLGLPPFVKTVPTAAYPGTTIFILGTDLTGATSVTFNGKAAAFAVVSATEIRATVPKGSTTGTVEVDTPDGTLSSNIPFRVF
jgi:uncharacterized repeat protein (TIGR03803 family)